MCVGGGARVDEPGWRSKCALPARRGEGRAEGAESREEEEGGGALSVGLLSRGGRRAEGGGGGAMDIAGGVMVDIVGANGFGGFCSAGLAVPRATAAADAGGSILVGAVVVVVVVEGESEK